MVCESASDISMIMDTSKLGDALQEAKRNERNGNRILKTTYTSKQTKEKLLRKRNDRQNNKSFDLTGQSIHDEQYKRFDDYSANPENIGLPAIKQYYKRMRTLDKRAQL